MKYIIVVPDGMADHPVESLGDKTPLEVANTANMDYLAKNGLSGLIRTIPKGMPPGSDIGNMAILGYDPQKFHTGRAPLEAANQNITLAENQIALRCNLVTIEKNIMVDYSAGHISTKEADILIKDLNKTIGTPDIKFYTGKSYRHLVVMTMSPEDCRQIKTVPPHDILGKPIQKFLPQGKPANAFINVMDQAKKVLAEHSVNHVRLDLNENPANMIWLWGQGVSPKLPPFQTRYGLKGAMISAVDLVNGIGRLAGLDVIDVPGITGYYDTNYLGKAQYALKALKNHDFVYIHIEAPDEAGHNGDVKAKIASIEKIDQDIIGTILNHFDKHDDMRLLVLPDHPTPVALRTHTNEPVCFAMYGKGIARNGVETFNESLTKERGLLFESGEDLMNHFIKKYI